MSGLLLVAAGGLAREVLNVERASGRRRPVRLLDDDPSLWGHTVSEAPVVGGIEEVKRHEDHEVLVCAGRGTARRALVTRLVELGVGHDRFATMVHPAVDLPADCVVGAGSILLAGVAVTAAVRVGRHVVVMPNATLTHDDVVDDYATLCAGVSLGGGVHVGEAAYVGMNASVRERLTVGAGGTLGMGAALVRDLPPGETWAGVPARPASSEETT